MIIGLILAGSVVGAVAGGTALVLGQDLWMALLIYCGTGIVAVLVGAARVAKRGGAASQPDNGSSTRPQHR